MFIRSFARASTLNRMFDVAECYFFFCKRTLLDQLVGSFYKPRYLSNEIPHKNRNNQKKWLCVFHEVITDIMNWSALTCHVLLPHEFVVSTKRYRNRRSKINSPSFDGNQLRVRAHFQHLQWEFDCPETEDQKSTHPSVLNVHNLVRILNGWEPMGDCDASATSGCSLESFLHHLGKIKDRGIFES